MGEDTDSTLLALWETPWSKRQHEKTVWRSSDIPQNSSTFLPVLPWCIEDKQKMRAVDAGLIAEEITGWTYPVVRVTSKRFPYCGNRAISLSLPSQNGWKWNPACHN